MATGSPIAPPGGSPPWRRAGRRGPVVVVLAAVGLAVLAVALIARAAGQAELVGLLREARWAWLAVCPAALCLAYTGYTLAYREGARVDGGPELGLLRSARLVIAGMGAMVAASSAGGLAVHMWALRRAGAPAGEAVRRVLALNTLAWGALGVAAAVAALLLLAPGGAPAPMAAALTWAVGVPLCILAAAWVSSPRRGARIARTEGRGRAARLFAHAVGGVIQLRRMLAHPRAHLGGAVGMPVYWGGHILCLYAGLRAFGTTIGPAALVLAFATGYAASALPLPAGGAGGVDAAMTFALGMVGVPLAAALLGVAAYRLATFWLPLVPALIVLPGLVRMHGELPAVPRAAAEG